MKIIWQTFSMHFQCNQMLMSSCQRLLIILFNMKSTNHIQLIKYMWLIKSNLIINPLTLLVSYFISRPTHQWVTARQRIPRHLCLSTTAITHLIKELILSEMLRSLSVKMFHYYHICCFFTSSSQTTASIILSSQPSSIRWHYRC